MSAEDEAPPSSQDVEEIDEEQRMYDGLALLEVVARRLERKLGGLVRTDELLAIGRLALLDIVRNYDPARSPFTPYCAQRLQWALMDGVRRETHGRTAFTRVRALKVAEGFDVGFAADMAQEPLEPTQDAAEARLGNLLAGRAAALALGMVSAAAEPDRRAEALSPEDLYAARELSENVRAIVKELPERERTLIERHYWGAEPLDRIGQDLGISKSWASRLHAQTLLKLSRAIKKL